MLSQAQRTAILELNTQQVSKREIARVLGISRGAVRKVLRAKLQRGTGTATEPRKPNLTGNRSWSFSADAKGNLVRVHENCWRAGRSYRIPR